ncbi:MAG TPA: ferredoxin [Mollicutes bacterium]|nr:ferredoxin [Mollicutes bacterium]
MRAKVDKDSCISCGACVSICPEVFEFDDDGFAVAIEEEINEDDFEKTKSAIESCPTDAIFEIKEND